MKLTRVERWILSNQYRILELLDSEEDKNYKTARTILERGYEYHYDEYAGHIYDEENMLTEDQCKEVVDILDMFSKIKRALDTIKDKSGINIAATEFTGFDGNHEVAQRAYAEFFCHGQGAPRFTELDFTSDLSSLFPTLDTYRRMLNEWKKSNNQLELTKDDILRITSAYAYPKE